MRQIAAKFVPRLLINDQRDHRVQVCTELQKAFRHDRNFLSRVITGDESWLYSYDPDPETKQHSSQWKTPSSPQPKKKCAKFAATSSQCFFFPFEDLCIRSLFHLVRLSMGILLQGFETTERKYEAQTA